MNEAQPIELTPQEALEVRRRGRIEARILPPAADSGDEVQRSQKGQQVAGPVVARMLPEQARQRFGKLPRSGGTLLQQGFEPSQELRQLALAPQLLQPNGEPEVNYRWPHLLWNSRGPAVTEGPACVGFVCGAAMLCRLSAFEGVGFFDERFFLYYEDDDLCLRLFLAQRPLVVVPSVTAVHRSRGSVRGRSPLRSEFIRGYHHAQSKLLFEHKHVSAASANRLRWKTLGLALLTLVPRLLVPQPKYLARLAGRIAGLCHAHPQPRS